MLFSVLVWSLQRLALLEPAHLHGKPSTRILPVLAAFPTIASFDTKSCIGNMIPNYYISMFEGKLGIILACGPAVRQFWAYRTRMHTCLPTKHRQYPNEDFEKMRYRINLRDIFWYRRAQAVGTSMSPPPDTTSGNPQDSSQVSNSVLDVWEKRIHNLFATGHHHKAVRANERGSTSRFSNTDNILGYL